QVDGFMLLSSHRFNRLHRRFDDSPRANWLSRTGIPSAILWISCGTLPFARRLATPGAPVAGRLADDALSRIIKNPPPCESFNAVVTICHDNSADERLPSPVHPRWGARVVEWTGFENR